MWSPNFYEVTMLIKCTAVVVVIVVLFCSYFIPKICFSSMQNKQQKINTNSTCSQTTKPNEPIESDSFGQATYSENQDRAFSTQCCSNNNIILIRMKLMKVLLTFGIDTLVRILDGDGVMDFDRRTTILFLRRVFTTGDCSLV